jgi:hypothetical protein
MVNKQLGPDESLRRLKEFLRQLESLLDDLVQNPHPVIPGRFHESMKSAWAEVQPKFQIAAGHLVATNTSVLEQAGLTGAQLEFKIAIFDYCHGELADHVTAAKGHRKKRPWWKRWIHLFLPTLKAADVVLGSLAEVLGPLGAPLEPIKEYKEAVEAGAEAGIAAGKK